MIVLKDNRTVSFSSTPIFEVRKTATPIVDVIPKTRHISSLKQVNDSIQNHKHQICS